MGIAFEHVPVVQPYLTASAPGVMHTRSPEFLKINPNGHVPSIDDDGLVLHESLPPTLQIWPGSRHALPLFAQRPNSSPAFVFEQSSWQQSALVRQSSPTGWHPDGVWQTLLPF